MAVLCLAATVTFRLNEPDFWQHLAVGRAIVSLGRIPTTQVWTWPTHGATDVNWAWGFEALMWGLWQIGHEWGLQAWRWVSTLAAFVLVWATARRMGARGLSAWVVVVAAAAIHRQRSQIRPETFVAVLMALQLWILESRRHGGRDRSAWLIANAWVWANVHLSWYFGPLLIGIHVLDDLWRRRAARGATASDAAPTSTRRLVLVGLGSIAVSAIHPSGWRALWEPFRFFLFDRTEPLFRIVSELHPLHWDLVARTAMPAMLVLGPLLIVARARRHGWDLAQILTVALFTTLALSTHRFIGPFAIVVTPYFARDLDAWVRSWRWPRWTEPAAARVALAALAMVAVMAPECLRREYRPGVGIDAIRFPVGACDYIAEAGVQGRGFNQFRLGGYLLWRFWPDPARLPFMDIHQTGTRELRAEYFEALRRPDGWRALDGHYRFDWALLQRPQNPGDAMLDALDADSAWALVFVDDAAALYVRRRGVNRGLAARDAYRRLGAGRVRLFALSDSCRVNGVLADSTDRELRRMVKGSPATATAHSFLANLALFRAQAESARVALERAAAIDALTPKLHERLGLVALLKDAPHDAIVEFERERRISGDSPELELRLGMAHQRNGDREQSRAAFRRALAHDPGNPRIRALVQTLEGAP